MQKVSAACQTPIRMLYLRASAAGQRAGNSVELHDAEGLSVTRATAGAGVIATSYGQRSADARIMSPMVLEQSVAGGGEIRFTIRNLGGTDRRRASTGKMAHLSGRYEEKSFYVQAAEFGNVYPAVLGGFGKYAGRPYL